MIPNRSGFSLMEVLVAVALVVVLATALVPNLLASADRGRAEAAALVLEELSDAISASRFDNQDWPSLLSHLSHGITTSDRNICGDFYNTGRVKNWSGPYFPRSFPATGLPIGIGIVGDTLGHDILSGGGGGAVAYLKIRVDSVAEEDARELNRIVDADDDPAAGTIRWGTASGSGLTTVEWLRTIKGC